MRHLKFEGPVKFNPNMQVRMVGDRIEARDAPRIILGFDPGFANFGWASVSVETPGFGPFVHSLGVFRTKKADKKRDVYASDDNAQRIRELTRNIAELLDRTMPVAIAVESQSWPRNSSASAKVGMAWGAMVALAEVRQIPMIQVSPQQVKLLTVGDKKASKEQVKDWVIANYGCAEPLKKLGALYEHAADAVAIQHAARTSDIFRAIARA